MEENFFYFNRSFLFIIIIMLQTYQIISQTLGCKISVPEGITSQQLNNIICIGISTSSNPNLETFSDGSLIVETSRDTGSLNRYFYGLTKDGRSYFKSDNNRATFMVGHSNVYRNDSENFVITINDGNHSEYLMSIGYDKFAEIYDLKEEKLEDYVAIGSFIEMNGNIVNLKQTGINVYDGNFYYFFYGYITESYFYLKKYKFISTKFSEVETIKTLKVAAAYGNTSSCFITDNKFIVCMFITKNSLQMYLFVYIYDLNLNEKLKINLDEKVASNSKNKYPYFLKCIHLKEDIGVFAFYKSQGISMVKNPYLVFKEYIGEELIDYIPQIVLNKKEFNTEDLFNDLIKINENKLCYIGTSENKEEMYIVLLNIYQNINIVIRYYNFNIFSLYTFKFYKNMRANLYNNFIAYAFSFCRTESCSSNKDTRYTGFMIFGYPNGEDIISNLTDLIPPNSENSDNYIIDLYDQVRIDNNIFGLKTSHIIIKNINCNSLIFYSSKNIHRTIIEGSQLDENEKIIVKIQSLFNEKCSIGYLYFIKEPEFEEYNTYPTFIDSPDSYNEIFFNEEKDIYQSKLLYYNISIPDENCLICIYNDTPNCIVYKSNYNEEESTNVLSEQDGQIEISASTKDNDNEYKEVSQLNKITDNYIKTEYTIKSDLDNSVKDRIYRRIYRIYRKIYRIYRRM